MAEERGRSRSRSFVESDSYGTAEEVLAASHAIQGYPSPSSSSSSSSGASSPASSAVGEKSRSGGRKGNGKRGGRKKRKTQLSKKTLSIVNDLQGQNRFPPSLSRTGSGSSSDAEAEAEEEAAREELAREREKNKAKAKGGKEAGGMGAGTALGPGSPSVLGAASAMSDMMGMGKGGSFRQQKKKLSGKPDYNIKILLLGDSGVGKTSLLERYANNQFKTNLMTTAGVDYKVQHLEIDGQHVKCSIWDTAGQERFHVITRAYYKGAHGIVLVYDVSDPKTFENVSYWLKNIVEHGEKDTIACLCANKVDLPQEQHAVDESAGAKLAAAQSMSFEQTSAKDGTGVQEVFSMLAKEIVKKNGAAIRSGKATVRKIRDPRSNRGKKEKDGCFIL